VWLVAFSAVMVCKCPATSLFNSLRSAAVATATLLIVDAWFDVTTAQPGWPLAQAILLAVFVELPTAALAFYILRRVERLSPRRKQAAEGTRGGQGFQDF